jgi:hypothetical protein
MEKIEPGAAPQEVARITLENIAADPDGFSMGSWASFTQYQEAGDWGIAPDRVPSVCGTTLCAAGWIAHALGWAVGANGRAVHPVTDQQSQVGIIGQNALGLASDQADRIWYAHEETALEHLRSIAKWGTI